jgi:hypothetical protein
MDTVREVERGCHDDRGEKATSHAGIVTRPPVTRT